MHPERYKKRRRGNGRLSNLLFVLVAICLVSQSPAAGPANTAPAKEVRRVLILYALGFSSPASVLVDREIRAALENSPYQIELYVESLQGILFTDSASLAEVRQEYLHRYRGRRPDVVIAVGPSPVKFLFDTPEDFGPDTPIVFCATTQDQLDGLQLDSRFTGAWRTVDSAKTLDAALKLQPATRHVVVVGGGAFEYDRRLENIVRTQLRGYETKLQFTYLSNLEMPVLLERLKRLPQHSIILYTAISRDAAGTHFIDETQSLPLVVGAANGPVFVMEDTFVGQGTAGGYVTPYSDEGRVAGGMAVRILKGEKPWQIPIVSDTNLYEFDWRAMRRWGLKERGLPSGSIVLYRQPTVWQAFKRYIVGAVFLCLAEAVLILALLSQRARRRKVEKSLLERLTFEELLSDLSTPFINLPEDHVDDDIGKGFGQLAEFLNVERVTIYELSRDKTELTVTSSWTREGAKPDPATVAISQFPWGAECVRNGELVLVSARNQLPQEASLEKAFLRKLDIASAASIPLKISGEAIGILLFSSAEPREVWAPDLVKQLIVLAEIYSNALARKRAVAELKLAEAVARESEKRFRLVADTAPVLIWMADSDKLCSYFNKGWLDFTGRSLEQESGIGWADGVHIEDSPRCLETYASAFNRREEFRMEYRLRRHDGEYRWILDIGVPRLNQHRSFIGYIGVGIDITDRKQAEAALASVSGRLIQAQEQERTRIARELHDDFGQRLALLAIGLQVLQNGSADLTAEVRSRVGELLKQTSEIGSDIQSLSHELHSSRLDYLGLATAIRGFCREFGDQQKVEVAFDSQDLPGLPSSEISLCLFRVLQEALHNAAKHSGVRHFEVELWGSLSEIYLRVSDSGAGFDSQRTKDGPGLGLTSMRERLALVNGEFSVESQPMRGTTIHARVPLNPAGNGDRAVTPLDSSEFSPQPLKL